MASPYLLNSIDYESVEASILGLLTQRKRLYPAHYVAIEIVGELLLPLAGREFMLTIQHIQERFGTSERVARSALQKLIDAGVLVETREYRYDTKTKGRLARRFKVGTSFYSTAEPANHWDGIAAFKAAGGSQEQYSTVKGMLARAGTPVTVSRVLEELARLDSERVKALATAYRFGGPDALAKVI